MIGIVHHIHKEQHHHQQQQYYQQQQLQQMVVRSNQHVVDVKCIPTVVLIDYITKVAFRDTYRLSIIVV